MLQGEKPLPQISSRAFQSREVEVVQQGHWEAARCLGVDPEGPATAPEFLIIDLPGSAKSFLDIAIASVTKLSLSPL